MLVKDLAIRLRTLRLESKAWLNGKQTKEIAYNVLLSLGHYYANEFSLELADRFPLLVFDVGVMIGGSSKLTIRTEADQRKRKRGKGITDFI